jgi:hypothetical protein
MGGAGGRIRRMVRHKKRQLLLLLTLAVLVAVSGAFLLPRRDDQITEANCDKIRKGMTRQELEAILGGPPDDYTSWPHAVLRLHGQEGRLRSLGVSWRAWVGEKGIILVSFDTDRKVDFVFFRPPGGFYKNRRGRFMDWLRDVSDRLRR